MKGRCRMREVALKGWFWHWGKLIYSYRWTVLVIWVLLFAGFSYFAQQAPSMLKDNGFTPYGSDAEVSAQLLRKELNISSSIVNVVYESESEDLTQQGAMQRIMDALEPVRKLSYISSIEFNQASRTSIEHSNQVQSVSIVLDTDTNEALEKYPELREVIKAPEGLKLYITGGTPVLYDMQEASKSDIMKAETIGLPIALIVLLFVFGTVIGAALPLVVGVMSVGITLGITYFIALQMELSNFLPNVVTMLGLAVGIDYALFMVSRFREELKKHPSVEDAVAMTSQAAGKSIFFSGAAVLIGLVAMLFVDLPIFRSFSLGGVLVVSLSVLIANTLLLALLGLFGHRINQWNLVPKKWKGQGSTKFWSWMAYSVMKRPVLIVIVLSSGLIALMVPVSSMKLGIPEAEVLPPSYDSRYGSDLLMKHYDEREMNPILISITSKEPIASEATIKQVNDYSEVINTMNNVRSVVSYVTVLEPTQLSEKAQLLQQETVVKMLIDQKLAHDHTTVIRVIPETLPDEDDTKALIRELRKLDAGDLQARVGGGPAYALDIIDRISDGIVPVLLFVMGITYVVLLIAFRSVLLPLKAVLMNMLSLGASLGVVVLVFQYGYFADLLNITSTGSITATLPVIIFCIVFGISMDYEVFLISRIIEEYEATGDNEASTAQGLRKTGGLITSAAFILIVVVGSFIFTDIEIMKALGLGLALAVLIDATVIRIFVVPALMKLLGSANWWAPSFIKPIRPKEKAPH